MIQRAAETLCVGLVVIIVGSGGRGISLTTTRGYKKGKITERGCKKNGRGFYTTLVLLILMLVTSSYFCFALNLPALPFCLLHLLFTLRSSE